MKDEELLDLLRTAARDDDRAFEAWMASPEGGGGVSESALAESLVARSLGQMGNGQLGKGSIAERHVDNGQPAKGSSVIAPERSVSPRTNVRALRSWKNIALGGAVVIALAASLTLIERRPHVAEVPPYEVAIDEGAEAQTRGGPNAERTLVYRSGAEIALTLRPATRVIGPIAVQCNLVTSRGTQSFALRSRANDAGVVTLRGEWPADFIGEAGQLVISIGRPNLRTMNSKNADPEAATFDSAHPPLQTVHVNIVMPSP